MMRRSDFVRGACVVLAVAVLGCKTGYTWRSTVPEAMRTVSVPTFRNETDLTGLGSAATRQVLRELQREGTFVIRREGDAALEIQGVMKSVKVNDGIYDRRGFLRQVAYTLDAGAEVSVIDKRSGKVLVDNRKYIAHTTFTTGDDIASAEREAAGRLADDLSQQIVDDLLNMKWQNP